ncbi:MAG: DMT family transporter, partial [Myxococcales bacterium]|nr:DMT family transporter [Myxococcales bacterium]
MTNTIKVNCALLAAMILWASSFIAIRLSLEGYSPGSVGLFRFILASMSFVIFFAFYAKFPKINLKQLLMLAVAGSFGTAAYSIFLNSGEQSISPAMASFLIAQTPVTNSIFAFVFLKERLSFNTLLAIIVSCIGVSIIVIGQPIESDFNFGIILVLMATFCGSLQSTIQKYILHQLSPLHVIAISVWFATASLLVFASDLISEVQVAPLRSSLAVVFLAFLPSIVGQWLWGYGLSKTTVAKASIYLYMLPFLSTLF